MSAIFISHSSKDKKLALNLHKKLLSKGYKSVFLDLDRDDGIVAGDKWEEDIYRELKSCQVLIALISENWLASGWCFAEATHAREKGKRILGLRLSPTIQASILSDTQFINFYDDQRASGYERLWLSLQNVTGPRFLLKWDAKNRPLYPGLDPFDELDAPVYFGRDQEAGELVEALRVMRVDREDPKRLLMLLGASGSGKSSLARAGVVHQLRREEREWVVVRPFRSGIRPVTEMAKALEATFARYGKRRAWQAIRKTLIHTFKSANSNHVIKLADQLRMASQSPDASVLLVIDQFEELFTTKESYTGEAEELGVFLFLLELILTAGYTPYRVLGTLRSDLLEQLQIYQNTRHLAYRPYHLELMKPENFRQVIKGPAQVAGIDIEEGLVDALVADTKTPDALPLLSFVLYELWKRYGAKRKLTLDEYRIGLGGIEGVIKRTAENALGAGPMPEITERSVRRAFSSLARITADRRFIKQRARWRDLPNEAHAILDRLVQARLLVSDMRDGEKVIEVAHDTVFRAWDRLQQWLKTDIGFLMWRERLAHHAREWEEANRRVADKRPEVVKATLLRGARLVEAEQWLRDREQDLNLSELALIQVSDRATYARGAGCRAGATSAEFTGRTIFCDVFPART